MDLSCPCLRRTSSSTKASLKKAGKIWKEYGALEYIEAVGDDLENNWGVPFTKAVKLKPGEIPFFSFIVFKSRADRDKVNTESHEAIRA